MAIEASDAPAIPTDPAHRAKGGDPGAAEHTAVAYFHGMGDQRRFEELSRLIDALDRYAFCSRHHLGQDVGRLEAVDVRLEPPRIDAARDVAYVRVRHRAPGEDEPGAFASFRFYEVYWAPAAAGGRSAVAVARWLFRQVPTPVRVLRSPWHERKRLRRGALHGLWAEARRSGDATYESMDFADLLHAYERWDPRASGPDRPLGRFDAFRAFVAHTLEGEPERQRRLLALSEVWRRRCVRTELLNLAILVTFALTLVLGAGALVLLVGTTLSWLARFLPGTQGGAETGDAIRLLADALAYGRSHVVQIAILAAGLLGLGKFLSDFMGDVQAWSTYQETDANFALRRDILDRSVQVLSHVLSDPSCTRLVIVAHSLGTAIAVDAMLELGRHNRARNREAPMRGPLLVEKLDHLITMGCPVDKIHYFFESGVGGYHFYNRFVEDVRGDIGTVPFAKNRKPHVHWVNFWDAADIISGPVETATSPRDPWLRVDNVQVKSLAFPDPGASHSAYFQHLDVVARLYAMIFQGEASLRDYRRTAEEGQADLDAYLVGPGTVSRAQRAVQVAALAVPWIVAAGFVADRTAVLQRFVPLLYWLAVGSAAALVVGWIAGRARGPLHPMPQGFPRRRRVPDDAGPGGG